MRVSLIGHGRLGKLISGFLSRDVDLEIFDQSIDRPLSDISQSSVVLLCVPISQMEKVCQEIAPHLKENTLVIDVCSVKEYPMNVMKKISLATFKSLEPIQCLGLIVFTIHYLVQNSFYATKAAMKNCIQKLSSIYLIKE